MALPITIPYTFANATSSIPLSNLDTDFSTIYSTVNGMGNGTVSLSTPTVSTSITVPTITSPGSTSLTLQSAGTTAITIDTSQNVGIGTSSPGSYGQLAVYGTAATAAVISTTYNASATGIAQVQAKSTGNYSSYLWQAGASYSTYHSLIANNAGLYATTNLSYEVDAVGYQNWWINGSERMRVDSNGSLLIGTSTSNSAYKLAVSGSGTGMYLQDTGSIGTYIDLKTGSGTVQGNIYYNFTNGYMTFGTASAGNSQTERMRLNSSGHLLVGTTTSIATSYNSNYGVDIGTYNSNQGFIGVGATVTSSADMIQFINPNGLVGHITVSGSSTSYTTSSDYRLKKNIVSLKNSLEKINTLKPVSYTWIADNGSGEGFIAHELQTVIPDAVTGIKDAVNENGTINPQGVDYSKIVVHLVAAIQELSAKNDALTARIAALEAK